MDLGFTRFLKSASYEQASSLHTSVFDLETNGFLRETNNLWCVGNNDDIYTYHKGDLHLGVKEAFSAPIVCGHNIVNFDIPALMKLGYITNEDVPLVIDTLIVARLMFPKPDTNSFPGDGSYQRHPHMQDKHSLKDWGVRLGVLKANFTDTNDFSKPTQEMYDYCQQDVEVTKALLAMLLKHKQLWEAHEDAIQLEHNCQWLLTHSFLYGCNIDMNALHNLKTQLENDIVECEKGIRWHRAKVDISPAKTKIKIRTRRVNPNSKFSPKNQADMPWLFDRLNLQAPTQEEWVEADKVKNNKVIKWSHNRSRAKVEKKTFGGKAIGEIMDSRLDPIIKWMVSNKAYGTAISGAKSIANLIWTEDGRLHPRNNPLGADTGRCTHSDPNTNFPKVKKDKQTKKIRFGLDGGYGAEFRSLVIPSKGRKLLGCDAGGLELVCFGLGLLPYDGGAMLREVKEGDPHQNNVETYNVVLRENGLVTITRDNGKTVTYAMLYGAGDEKIAKTLGCSVSVAKKLKEAIKEKWVGFNELEALLRKQSKEDRHIQGLDRRIPTKGDNSLINYKFQGMGAIITKRGMIWVIEELFRRGHKWGKDFTLLLYIHDEIEFEYEEYMEKDLVEVTEACWTEACKYYNLPTTVEGEAKIGASWRDVH